MKIEGLKINILRFVLNVSVYMHIFLFQFVFAISVRGYKSNNLFEFIINSAESIML